MTNQNLKIKEQKEYQNSQAHLYQSSWHQFKPNRKFTDVHRSSQKMCGVKFEQSRPMSQLAF